MFQVQASTSASDAGLGGEVVPALITVFPANDCAEPGGHCRPDGSARSGAHASR